MKTALLVSNLLLTLAWSGVAAINVPLTIQEAIYSGGVAGVARTGDPVTVGIPLPDDAATGVTDIASLGLSGTTVAQFRVLGRWPSGRIKWLLVDTQADVNAGQKNTSIALTSGSGNFGGANLATDNGTTITVNTGAAVFTIKKARFNLVDQVVMGQTTVVRSGTSPGLVVTGPAPGQTVCPPCTTVYSSSNDPNSTAVIEENGPAKTVIKASGSHVDSSGNIYMRFTVRMYFYKSKSFVKVTSVLRNADYGTSNTFATAYKGFQGYELRVTANLTGTANYTIANHTSTASTGQLSAGDDVYLYQGTSTQMKISGWCGYGCVPYTNDAGYRIAKNGTTVLSGTTAQFPQGWADVSDSNGVGVEIGNYQMAAYESESLEFGNGGSDVHIGTWAPQNSQAYYQSWPQWSIRDVYLNFHSSALATPANEFLKYQHYLLARAPYTHYNATQVFPYPLLDPAVEDSFYTNTANSANPAISTSKACCIQDFGLTDTYHWPLTMWRYYSWGNGGGSNQSEFRWSQLLNFITRGFTGRYLDAASFYRMQAGTTFPMSDGFDWRNRPAYQAAGAELDGFGQPKAASANAALGFRDWHDQEHNHSYGMADYYFMSGDETIHEGMLEGMKDWFLNPNTYQAGSFGGVWNARAVGVELMGAARFSQMLAATGDPDAVAVANQGISAYNAEVKPDLCVSGYPAGCVLGKIDGGPWSNSRGVSRTRGVQFNGGESTSTWCNVSHNYRRVASFMEAILVQGILELRNVAGPSWSDYWNSLDLAYGIAQWATNEMFVDDGTGRWGVNGFRYKDAIDVASTCTAAGETPEPDFAVAAQQTVSAHFMARYLVEGDTGWATKFKINLQKDMNALGTTTSDFGSFHVAAVIDSLNKPVTALSNVPLAQVRDNGGGSYTISWTVPAGAQSYRIKWAPTAIVDWIGFDNVNNRFIGSPSTTTNWFAAANASNIPAPAAAGTTQSITISTGITGLAAANFSVKAYVPGSAPATPDFSLSSSTPAQSIAPGGSTNFIVNVTAVNGFSSSTGFSVSGQPAGVTAAFNPTTVSTSGSTTLAVTTTSSVAPGSYPLTITATGGGLTHTTSVVLTIGSPDFTITTASSSVSLVPGGNGSSTLTVAPSNSFAGAVALSASGLPAGVTAAFNPATLSGGSGSSNLTFTASSSAATGNYTVTVTAASGSLSHTAAIALKLTTGGVGGTLTGFMATPPAAVQLTLEGTSDWAHWGLNTATDYNSGPAQQISNISLVGSSALSRYANNSTSFTWTNGTPTASATASTTGVFVSGQGNGFTIKAPADTTVRTLKVYVGAWRSTGTFTAQLSDGSAADYTDSSLTNSAGVTTLGVYSLTYVAASAGQTLTVTFTQSTSGSGNVTLQAATLAGGVLSPAGTASNLTLAGGNNQTGTAGIALPTPLSVKVTDSTGSAVAGTSVTFSVTAGGGTVSPQSATTNSQGIASTTLTLGGVAGTNTVTATSGTLAGSPVTFTATGWLAASGNQTTINWTRVTGMSGLPGNNEWFTIPYDPVSQQTIAYATLQTSMSIYSTDLFFYNPSTKVWTRFGGSGDLQNNCPADTPTQPGNRHPVGQMAIDTKRNFLWISGGVCGGVTRPDTYYMSLNGNPMNNTWHQVTTAHNPFETRFSSMVYDPDDDVLFSFGYDLSASTHDNWVFCRTAENPTPGVLTAKQSAAGCGAPDDWTEVRVVGGTVVPGSSFPGLVYDPVTKKVLLFGGGASQTWAYDIPTKTWTRKALATQTPPVDTAAYWGMPAWAYNTATHRILYHQTGGTGAPADWEYDPVADTWTHLTSTGVGATSVQVLSYDASRNLLIGVNKSSSGGMEVWHGTPSTGSVTAAPGSRCDLNGDGVIDSLDVDLMVDKALGRSTCSASDDLSGDGMCTVVEVQRVVNASLGGTCRIGQ